MQQQSSHQGSLTKNKSYTNGSTVTQTKATIMKMIQDKQASSSRLR